MAGNPLHFLISTLVRFIGAVSRCHEARTDEERRRAQSAWTETKEWFWPRYRYVADAIRELADPALAWCSEKGFRDQTDVNTIETAASFITGLAKLAAPCASSHIYSNEADAWNQWEREGSFLLQAEDARRDLQRLTARAGDLWRRAEGADAGRDQSETDSKQSAATSTTPAAGPEGEQQTAAALNGNDWPTVTAAAQAAACDAWVITRAVNKGELKSNGKQRRERRIDPADFTRWLIARAARPQPEESTADVERKLKLARNE